MAISPAASRSADTAERSSMESKKRPALVPETCKKFSRKINFIKSKIVGPLAAIRRREADVRSFFGASRVVHADALLVRGGR